jgi:hypothetical protein
VPLQKKDEPLSMLVQLSYQLHANSISKTEIEFHFSFLISLLGEISFFSFEAQQQTSRPDWTSHWQSSQVKLIGRGWEAVPPALHYV